MNDPHTRTDEELARAAIGGDVRALDDLLRRHEVRLLRLLRLLGVPASDREDVAQEVFLRVFRHLGGFRPDRPFSAWINRIAVNAANDQRRRMLRQQQRETGWHDRFLERPAQRPDPAAALETEGQRLRLERALDSLSLRERAVFVLCEMEGGETREVARSLGISSITVRRHLGRARKRLRRVLEQDLEKKPAGD